ncbi:MAG: hypothetical protein J1F35_04865 [Erysipelotrichales bacterium]|nr:hypothetical protein [Erysipelotrichales bacterium]
MAKDIKPYSKRRVRNNGKDAGEIILYKKNVVSIFGMGLAMGIGLGVVIGLSTKQPEVNHIAYNTLSDSYFDEPTYNGIPYIVKFGENVSDIVYSYEQDSNKVQKIISEIEYLNKIDANNVKAGQEILLCGVPASRLEDFGYTDNYNLFGETVEIDMRLDFLTKVTNGLDRSDEVNDNFVISYEQAKNEYEEYKRNYLPGDEYMLPDIIDRLIVLCEEAKNYGYRFEDNKKALPLDQALDQYKGQGLH